MAQSTADVKAAMSDGIFMTVSSLLNTGLYSDMTVECGELSWKVHCTVLMANSNYFVKACQNNFLEGQTKTITLHDDDPDMVSAMLCFLYTGNYKDGEDHEPSVFSNAGMYALGDKYDIPLLKDLAAIEFKKDLEGFDLTMTLELLEAIKVIYTTTLASDKVLREALIPVLKAYKTALRRDEAFMEVFHSGLADGEFADDVLDAWVDFESPAVAPASTTPFWTCNSCQTFGCCGTVCDVCGHDA